MRKIFFVVLIMVVGGGIAWAQGGVKKRKALPYEYGSSTINNFSQQAGMPRWCSTIGYCHLRAAFPMNDCKRCHPQMGSFSGI